MQKLTVEAARALAPGQVLKCHVVRGLELHAGRTGKTWKLYYRAADSTQRRPKIGTFPTLSIEAAREVAKDWHKLIAKGEDPSAERRAVRLAPTVDDLFKLYEREVIEKEYGPETKVSARSAWSVYILPKLGKVRVCDVTVADINNILRPLGERHHAMAANVRAYASRAFALAESSLHGWRPRGSNPCRDPECLTFGVRRRRRHIKPGEFRAIGDAMAAHALIYPDEVACLYAILFAGSRISEMARARVSDLVVDELGARIVPADHKTKRHGVERTIWLPRQAVAILLERRGVLRRNADGYLFGKLGELRSPRRNVWKVWDLIRNAAGAPDLQPRDLRRTFASAARTGGLKLDDVGQIFDHTSTTTTKHYAYLFEGAEAEKVQSVGDELSKLLEGPKP